ncbi:MAG TPA: ABC transporter substrate-binding protein [Acidimicrobiia bacterium]|nr:ABC transporter substrate-binding protein [Acidimicrobiia bacterium]
MRARKLLVFAFVAVFVLGACGGSGAGDQPAIRVGSDNFYESRLIAEIYAQVLENEGYRVERRLSLGTRQDRVPALEEGEVDLVPEYVGSGLGYYDTSQITGDGETNAERLQAILEPLEITVLEITPGEDTNTAAVRAETAEEFQLDSIGDLVGVQDELIWGLPPDCDVNPQCRGALELYGLDYPPALRESFDACEVPMAEALNGRAIDVAWLCANQPAIVQYGFVELTDDLGTQPAENIAPLVRNELLASLDHEETFVALLNDVSSRLTTEELSKLGVEMEIEERDVREVATEWLTQQGLLG